MSDSSKTTSADSTAERLRHVASKPRETSIACIDDLVAHRIGVPDEKSAAPQMVHSLRSVCHGSSSHRSIIMYFGPINGLSSVALPYYADSAHSRCDRKGCAIRSQVIVYSNTPRRNPVSKNAINRSWARDLPIWQSK